MDDEMNTGPARKWQTNHTYHTEPEPKKVVVKVKSKSWLTKGEKVIYAFLCAAIIACGMFIVSYSSTTDALNRDTQALNDKVNAQEVENENLLFEVRELSKPERITKVAKENGLEIQESQVKRAAN